MLSYTGKIVAAILFLTLLNQAFCIIHLKATLDGKNSTIELMRENAILYANIKKTNEALTDIHIRLGESYKVVLANLLDRLGINTPKNSSMLAILDQFDRLSNSKSAKSVGGPK